MSAVTVRASTSAGISGGVATRVFTFPGTPQTGDPIGIWVTTNNQAHTVTAPSGWTLAYSEAVGTGSRHFLHKVYAPADGASVSATFSTGIQGSYAIVVLDGTVHTDFGALGTITTRAVASTSSTALATGTASAPNLVVFHEKTTSQTSCTLTPTTTDIVNQMPPAGIAGSIYVGTYDDAAGTADRTATYALTGNVNGCGYQVPVALVAGPASASLAGSGTLTATGTPATAATAALAGSGALAATGVPTEPGTAFLSGTGALTAVASSIATTGTATLAGTGALTATGRPTATGTAAFTGTGALTVTTGALATWLGKGSPRWCGHRDGFASTYGEFTVAGFQALAAYNRDIAWNIDVFKTTDGEWVASHDQTTGRVLSGTSLDIPSSTWSAISGKTTIVGGNPVARIDDIVAVAPAGTVFFVDNKQNTNTAAFFTKLASLGLNPTNTVNKNYIGSTAMLTAAHSNGYTTWGYAFDADMSALASNHGLCDWLGFDFNGSQANWNTAMSYGQPSFAHILTSSADRTTADTKATTAGGSNFGYMVSGVPATIAQASTATASLTGTGSLAATGKPASAAAATLSGAGTLTAVGKAAVVTTAALGGTGSLAAAGAASQAGTATLGGAGTLTATATPTIGGAATLTGTGGLAVVGGNNSVGTAALAGAGTLAVTGRATVTTTATFTGTGTLLAASGSDYSALAALSGAGQLAATGHGGTAPDRDIDVTATLLGLRWRAQLLTEDGTP